MRRGQRRCGVGCIYTQKVRVARQDAAALVLSRVEITCAGDKDLNVRTGGALRTLSRQYIVMV